MGKKSALPGLRAGDELKTPLTLPMSGTSCTTLPL